MSMPVACTFNVLSVSLYGVSGSTNLTTLTLVKNGVDTALTSSANSVTGSVIKCTDTTHTVAVAVGDIMALKLVQASGTPFVRVGIGTRCN